MKHTLLTLAAIGFLSLISCDKESAVATRDVAPANHTAPNDDRGQRGSFAARYIGPNYSQPIPKDTANRMIQSYLLSVGYPGVDTTLRALTFDADTLRSYLSNPTIATVKLMFAHKPGYMNSGNYGINGGLNPNAFTLVVVGLTEHDQYVMNSSNGVYDNFNPCPAQCPGASGTFIY